MKLGIDNDKDEAIGELPVVDLLILFTWVLSGNLTSSTTVALLISFYWA